MSSTDAGNLDASSVANIVSANFKAYNINFKNTYGSGSQAVAVTANGDKQGFYGCGFYGYQDTLYAKNGKQYYSNCYMEGAVDYIFGNAAAWFGECTIASNGGGAITATSREDPADASRYVFDHSTVGPPSRTVTASVRFLTYNRLPLPLGLVSLGRCTSADRGEFCLASCSKTLCSQTS
jgi:pectinesterase